MSARSITGTALSASAMALAPLGERVGDGFPVVDGAGHITSTRPGGVHSPVAGLECRVVETGLGADLLTLSQPFLDLYGFHHCPPVGSIGMCQGTWRAIRSNTSSGAMDSNISSGADASAYSTVRDEYPHSPSAKE